MQCTAAQCPALAQEVKREKRQACGVYVSVLESVLSSCVRPNARAAEHCAKRSTMLSSSATTCMAYGIYDQGQHKHGKIFRMSPNFKRGNRHIVTAAAAAAALAAPHPKCSRKRGPRGSS